MNIDKLFSHNIKFLLMLAIMIPIAQFGLDLYTPSFPAITKFFNVVPSITKISISIFTISFAFSSLFFGVFSERYGRRRNYIIGIIFFTIGSFLPAKILTINAFLAARLLQGIGAGCSSVIIRSSIADLYEGKALFIMYAFYTFIWGLAMCLSPAIGAYLQHYFKWQTDFYFLFIYSCFLLIIIVLFYPETIKNRKRIGIKDVYNNYKLILMNRQTTGSMLIGTCGVTGFMTFAIMAPFIIQENLKLPVISYGYIGLLMGANVFFAALTANKLLKMFSPYLIIKISVAISMIISSVNFVFYYFFSDNYGLFFLIPLYTIIFFLIIINISAMGFAVSPFRHLAGFVTSAQAFVIWLFSGALTAIIALLPSNVAILSLVLFILAIANLYIFTKIIIIANGFNEAK